MSGGKRGIAQVITTVIMVGLALAAISIVGVVINNLIKSNTNEISLGKLTVVAEVENANVDAVNNNITLLIKRDIGAGDFAGIRFFFSDGNQSETTDQIINLAEIQEQAFTLHLNIVNVSNLVSVGIVPLIQNGNARIVGSNSKVYNITDIKVN